MTAGTDALIQAFRPFVVDGIPSSGANEPDKTEIIAALTRLAVDIGAAQAGIHTEPTIAARDTYYATPANRGNLVYVNNNNGSATDSANGVYEYVSGAARLAQGFYAGLTAVVQPSVDDALAAAGFNLRSDALAFASRMATGEVTAVYGEAANATRAAVTGEYRLDGTAATAGDQIPLNGRYTKQSSGSPILLRTGSLDSQIAKQSETGASGAAASASASAAAALAAPLDAERRGKVSGINIFDFNRAVANTAIRLSDGAPVTFSSRYASDFIRVEPSSSISTLGALFGDGTYGLAFYTAAATANFISGSGVNGLAAGATVSVPATANFVRFTMGSLAIARATDVVRSTVAPTVFRAFDFLDTYSGPIDTRKRVAEVLPFSNLFDPANVVQGYYNVGTGALVPGGTYASTLNPVPVTPGAQYTFKELFQGNAAVGIVWLADDGTTVVGSNANNAGYTFTAPINAGFMKASWADTWPQRPASYRQMIVPGATLPAAYLSYDRVSAHGAAVVAQKRIEASANPVIDFYDPSQRLEDSSISAVGAVTVSNGNDLTNIIPGYPGCQRVSNVSIYNGSGSGGISFYDRDSNFLFLGYLVGGQVTTTSGSPTATLTAGTGRLYKGMPISSANYPAGTYVVDFTDPNGAIAGTVTFSANATASGTGVAISGGGLLRDVPIIYPDPACGARFLFSNSIGYGLQITNAVPAVGQGAFGLRNVRARQPLNGQPVITGGDSLIEGGNDAGGGAPPQYGVIQWSMRKECGFNLVEARGSGGCQTRQLFDDRGNGLGPVVSVTFTATITINQTTLTSVSVSSGTLVAGMRVSALNGMIRPGTTLVDAGGGSWSLSQPAAGSATATAMRAGTFANVRYYTDDSGTNSWGVWTGGVAVAGRADAQVVLGTVADTWVPTDFSASVTNGQTTLSGITVTRGALANGMPVLALSGVIPVGTTLVDLGGGSWGLSQAATATASITGRAGTFTGDLYDIFVRKLLAYEPNCIALLGTPPRRFDGTGNPNASTGANLADKRAGDPMNTQGVRLSQFAQMKLDWAKYYGFPSDDMFGTLGVNEANFQQYFNADYVHWNRLGNTRIWAPRWARFLNSQPLPLDY